MPRYLIREAAEFLAVSDDTVRRWIEAGRLTAATDKNSSFQTIDGAQLARFAQQLAAIVPHPGTGQAAPISARNKFPGLVTRVIRDTVMAQVEIQAGPHRLVSLISREAADELGLEPGVAATAVVKATNVVVELKEDK